ncbi:MAG: GAF domain-containing sensor histidine kinase, partial [Anaerolineae bacterium]|nr:GAF domain-containing sensor histidine kinase [Anaerolineae bacterium]
VRWLRDYAQVSWQDKPSPKTHIRGAVQDITLQKQAEEALGYRLKLEQMITTISTHFINLTPQEAHSEFDKALEAIGYFVDADQSYVYLVSEDRTQLSKTYEWCCAQSLAPTIQEQSYAIPKAVWWKIQLQTTLPFPTELTIPELGNPVTAGLYAEGKKTLLTMPMIHANEYIGFLCVEWLAPRKGKIRTDTTVYRTLTDIFTSAIIRHRADLALYRRHREQALLNRVIITASMTSDIEQILQVLCEELTLNFEIPQTIIYFINALRNTARVIAEYQASGMGSIYGNTIPLAHPIISDILAQPRPRFLGSTEVMSLREALDFPPVGTTALLIVPIVIQNQVLGLMFMSSIAPLTFNEEDLELIQSTVAVTERALEATMLQQELREHAQELEHLVNQRTQELRIALQHAQAADRAKSEFVSNVSHELRTPLTNIKLYLDLLNRGQQQRRATYMETIHREANRLQKLIEDLLTLSRLDLGKVEVNMESIDLNALIHMLVEDRRPLFTHKGLSLNVHTTQGLPYIYADAKLIEQVLTNLLSNALNYTLSGNVTLTTKIDTIKSQPWVTVSVQDTGVGIPVEEQTYLFERFLRGSAGNTTQASGSGLGLAISKEIANLHGGHINVESKVGVGSTFTVWLPIGEK